MRSSETLNAISAREAGQDEGESSRLVLERAKQVVEGAKTVVENCKHQDPREARMAKRLSGRLQALLFVMNLGMAAGVYKGMDRLADGITHSIREVTDTVLNPFKRGSVARQDDVLVPPVHTERPAARVRTQQAVPAIEARAAEAPVEVDQEEESIVDNDGTAGQTIADVLIDVMWNDQAFKELRTPAEVESFITNRIEDMCPVGARGCDQETLRSHLVSGLRERVSASMQTAASSPEHMARIARGIRLATPASDNDADHRSYGELDVALQARDPRLVEDFMHSDLGGDGGPVSAHLADYVTSRIDGVQTIYGQLSPDGRQMMSDAIRQNATHLADLVAQARQHPVSSGSPRAAQYALWAERLAAMRQAAETMGITL